MPEAECPEGAEEPSRPRFWSEPHDGASGPRPGIVTAAKERQRGRTRAGGGGMDAARKTAEARCRGPLTEAGYASQPACQPLCGTHRNV